VCERERESMECGNSSARVVSYMDEYADVFSLHIYTESINL